MLYYLFHWFLPAGLLKQAREFYRLLKWILKYEYRVGLTDREWFSHSPVRTTLFSCGQDEKESVDRLAAGKSVVLDI